MIDFPQLLLFWTAFYLLVFWLPALFAPKTFRSVLEKTVKNVDFVRVRWFVIIVLWLLYLTVYQSLNNGWVMFFSIFWYVSLLKGTVFMRWPSWLKTKYTWFFSKKLWSIFMGVVCVIFSALIAWVALMKF